MAEMHVVSYAKLPRIRHGKRYRGRPPVIKAINFYALQQRVRKLEQALRKRG